MQWSCVQTVVPLLHPPSNPKTYSLLGLIKEENLRAGDAEGYTIHSNYLQKSQSEDESNGADEESEGVPCDDLPAMPSGCNYLFYLWSIEHKETW